MTKNNILVVDDEYIIGKVINRVLSKYGYNVTYSQNSEEVIDLMNKTDFHILIIDIKMPKINGIELVKIIRKKFTAIPIIIMTGSVDYEVTDWEIGEYEFIEKPFEISDLLNTVKKFTKT